MNFQRDGYRRLVQLISTRVPLNLSKISFYHLLLLLFLFVFSEHSTTNRLNESNCVENRSLKCQHTEGSILLRNFLRFRNLREKKPPPQTLAGNKISKISNKNPFIVTPSALIGVNRVEIQIWNSS